MDTKKDRDKIIAIIPARGGSKGIKGKNLMDFLGKPLVAWSIIQALSAKEIDEVFVSSDSDEILDISSKNGAKTIKRPDNISGDTATTESALQHAMGEIGDAKSLILMQPTSPLRKRDDLSNAISQYLKEGCDSLFSGALLEDFLIWDKNEKGDLCSINYDYQNRGRRQDRTPQYVENGSFYIFKPEVLKTGNRLGGKIGVYLMDFWQSSEIDSPEDVEIVKTLFSVNLKGSYGSIPEHKI